MWWVLTIVFLLIFFERRHNHNFDTAGLFDIKNYFWLIMNLVVLSFLIQAIIPLLTGWLEVLHLPRLVNLTPYNAVVQFLIFLLIIDFSKYLSHYFMHKINFLWKIHLIHHSSTTMNTLASFKHSWAEAFINIFLGCFLERFFKIDLAILTAVNGIFIYVCVWQHSSLKYYKSSLLSAIFITPSTHHIHHEKADGARHKNFGFIFTIWDRIFSTYCATKRENLVYGIDEANYPQHSNLKQFVYPFWVSNSK